MGCRLAQKTKQRRGTWAGSAFLDKTAATTLWASGREQLIPFDSSGVYVKCASQQDNTVSDRLTITIKSCPCQKDKCTTTSHKLTCWKGGQRQSTNRRRRMMKPSTFLGWSWVEDEVNFRVVWYSEYSKTHFAAFLYSEYDLLHGN
jgi:hypothetical protein